MSARTGSGEADGSSNLAKLLAASPLQRAFDPPAQLPKRRPPLPLSPGHIAMMLVSGQLDSLVVEGERLHVARGIEGRESFLTEDSWSTDAKGNQVHKVVHTTGPQPKIRAAYQDGRIEDYG